MVELGMEPSHVDTLARALFGSVNQPMEEVDDDEDEAEFPCMHLQMVRWV